MKKNKILLTLMPMLAIGCTSNKTSTSVSTGHDGAVTTRYLNQENHEVALVEESRQACYAAAVEIEANKAKANTGLLEVLVQGLLANPHTTPGELSMAMMMVANQQNMQVMMDMMNKMLEVVSGESSSTLDTCGGMNVYEYKQLKSQASKDFWGNLAGNVLKYGTAAFLGSELIDAVAKDTISAGDNSIIAGRESTYSPNNSVSTSTTDSNDISSSNTESGPGDNIDSPEIDVPEVEVPELPETLPEEVQ